MDRARRDPLRAIRTDVWQVLRRQSVAADGAAGRAIRGRQGVRAARRIGAPAGAPPPPPRAPGAPLHTNAPRRTRMSAPRRVNRAGRCPASGPLLGAAATRELAAVAGPRPGIDLISMPSWANAMMSCQVCAGREPPVMRLVEE